MEGMISVLTLQIRHTAKGVGTGGQGAMAPHRKVWIGFGMSPYWAWAVYVHCYAHSLNLVLQETARQVPIIRDSLEYLHRAAILMGRSAKRKSILHAW